MFNNKSRLITQLQSTIYQQQVKIDQLIAQIDINKSNMADYESTISKLQSQLSKYSREQLDELNKQISIKQSKLTSITRQLIDTENSIQLQSLSFFDLQYSSQYYKDELKSNRLKQRECLNNKSYFTMNESWFINGSKRDGDNLSKFLINICISSYNQLCDATMQKVNVANYADLSNKLKRAYDNYNQNLVKFNIKLNLDYLELKLAELELNRNISIKLDEEKEELARQREIVRENLRIEKDLLKEREKMDLLLVKLRAEQTNGSDVQSQIDEIEEKLGDNDKLLKNSKAGWIYIINSPSFGKDTYKIGLSRRSNPMNRIDELSSASVPFVFKPNCILYSDDAFELEGKLHKEFSQYRVNKINMRKEYFKLPLSEIERVIKDKYDPCAIFNHDNIDNNFLASGYSLSDNFILDKDA